MDKRPFTCCFTGHRNLLAGQENEIWKRVYACLEPLLKEGVRYFGVGGALGFDTLVAERLIALRGMRKSMVCGCGTWPSPADGANCALLKDVGIPIMESNKRGDGTNDRSSSGLDLG